MIKIKDEILFEFAKKMAGIPIPEVPVFEPEPQEKEDAEPNVGSPQWVAQNHPREFLTRTERGKPNWLRPEYNELARNTLTNVLIDRPENFFTWELYKQDRFSDLTQEAANNLINKDPLRALLHPKFSSFLTSGHPSLPSSFAKRLWSEIMQKHNPAGWDKKTDRVLFTKLRNLTNYVENAEGHPLQMEVGTTPTELGQIGGTEWVAEKYPRIFLKDKSWKAKNTPSEVINLRLETANKVAKEEPRKYFDWELHRLDFPDPEGKGMHPTAIAASNFIDKDPVGALLNKNFFNVLGQADRVKGLDKSMLKLLWDKLTDHDINNNKIEFSDPTINAWFHKPPITDPRNLQEDIIGSQLGRLAKKLSISGGSFRQIFERTPESQKDFPGHTTERKIHETKRIQKDVEKKTRQHKDMERKREKRLSQRDK